MILTVGGIKGGSGKTTVATHLAVMRSLAGHDVLLIDADDQATSTDFTALRNERREGGAGYTCIQLAGAAVRTETMRLRAKYADIVIDVGGRDTASQRAALVVSDTLIVPFVPRSFDVWTLEKISELVAEIRTVNAGLRAYTCINRADPRGSDNADAAEYLGGDANLEHLETPLGTRKAFGNAAAAGLIVTELRPGDDKAEREIIALYAQLYGVNPNMVAWRGA